MTPIDPNDEVDLAFTALHATRTQRPTSWRALTIFRTSTCLGESHKNVEDVWEINATSK